VRVLIKIDFVYFILVVMTTTFGAISFTFEVMTIPKKETKQKQLEKKVI
jgi:hypothetical protein